MENAPTKRDSTALALVHKKLYWLPIQPSTPRGLKCFLINRKARSATIGTVSNNESFFTHYFPIPTFARDEDPAWLLSYMQAIGVGGLIYPLPTELYPSSKDWLAADYAGRVEWLHVRYEAVKDEVESLHRTLAEVRSTPQKPVAVTDAMVYAFHRMTSDSSLGSADVEEIRKGLTAALACM